MKTCFLTLTTSGSEDQSVLSVRSPSFLLKSPTYHLPSELEANQVTRKPVFIKRPNSCVSLCLCNKLLMSSIVNQVSVFRTRSPPPWCYCYRTNTHWFRVTELWKSWTTPLRLHNNWLSSQKIDHIHFEIKSTGGYLKCSNIKLYKMKSLPSPTCKEALPGESRAERRHPSSVSWRVWSAFCFLNTCHWPALISWNTTLVYWAHWALNLLHTQHVPQNNCQLVDGHEKKGYLGYQLSVFNCDEQTEEMDEPRRRSCSGQMCQVKKNQFSNSVFH